GLNVCCRPDKHSASGTPDGILPDAASRLIRPTTVWTIRHSRWHFAGCGVSPYPAYNCLDHQALPVAFRRMRCIALSDLQL
ncbi:hypothetical protein, partial [Citrobacter sp. R-1.5.2]|uniref:hypothetical protein n=1 Tax=Citrobacter sp. R-1.5.2 TaxID=3046183 RepID=UPI002B24C7AE